MWTAGAPLGKEVTRVPGGTAQDLVSLLGMAQFKTHESLISGIFHFTFLDHS